MRTKQEIATLIREIQQLFKSQESTPDPDPYQELLVNLAEDRFNLAVVGQFKRGKSSLMNAVIGRDLLPTGLLPLTSAITSLCYGQERVLLRRKGWMIEPEVSVDELADYVTERGNPGNEKGLIEARMEIPVRFLRRGLHFIDTPGIGLTRQENTATTYEFLPKADAVIFVTSVDGPLSEAEEIFLGDIRQYVRKLFIVVNKTDLLAETDQAEVLHYIQTGFRHVLGSDQIRIYPLSASQALQAKLAEDAAQLEQSGLPEFEAALTAFLAEEKEAVFLLSVLERLSRYLLNAQAPADTANGYQPDAANRLLQIRVQLTGLHGRLSSAPVSKGTLPPAAPRDQTGEGERDSAAILSHIKRKDRPMAAEEATDEFTFSADTCPICDTQSETLFQFFAQLQYALVMQDDTRRAFAQVHGLCCVHTWQFQQIASPQAISEGYAPLIEQMAFALRRLPDPLPTETADAVESLLPSQKTCLACATLHEHETDLVARFCAVVATTTGQAQYARKHKLCLPHLQAVLAIHPPQQLAEFLLHEQIRHLEEISEDMRSYSLKRVAVRRWLQNADEQSACAPGIGYLGK